MALKNYLKQRKKTFIQAVENIIQKKCAKFEEDRFIIF